MGIKNGGIEKKPTRKQQQATSKQEQPTQEQKFSFVTMEEKTITSTEDLFELCFNSRILKVDKIEEYIQTVDDKWAKERRDFKNKRFTTTGENPSLVFETVPESIRFLFSEIREACQKNTKDVQAVYKNLADERRKDLFAAKNRACASTSYEALKEAVSDCLHAMSDIAKFNELAYIGRICKENPLVQDQDPTVSLKKWFVAAYTVLDFCHHIEVLNADFMSQI
jgi:hypothetical protein